MAQAAEPPSGTRDFLADEVRRREAAFATVREVFERYGFDPLVTPAFERIETLLGKYGDEGDKLVFKILKRGEHEASGEADLALRYDLTVPLARVVATYGSQLPSPYKRYAIGPVWRADRPGKGRFREFTQCDFDIVGSSSELADAEVLAIVHDGVRALGVEEFTIELNSRQVLFGLLQAYRVPAELGGPVLITLDKLNKLEPAQVVAELVERGLAEADAQALVDDLTAGDPEVVRARLDDSEQGKQGLAQVDRLLELTAGLPVRFAPRMVRGLDYYTGMIFEVTAAGFTGSIASGGRYDGLVAALGGPDMPAVGGSIGLERILSQQEAEATEARGLDVAVTVLGAEERVLKLAADLRAAGLRTGVYLGSSGKLARQLKWANAQRAAYAVLYGPAEQEAGTVTVRDMTSGEQTSVPLDGVVAHLSAAVRTDRA
ncbi:MULTISPECIES: histidine--tRNA ligase [Thermocrispum]|jgi:histidyl-tRNA synthetase|uniref:Histidine--tRNA ligase n=1 Tax=Thermocrispum agreste TaxID=37925 RepID=A0A2W4JKJ8_9PSEU|nr:MULTISPECIES: histidine--tRNA ligase [Thermocrispum]PZM98698.1 MAG: histidine--tRNA ligase [Thermocrispum agreste]